MSVTQIKNTSFFQPTAVTGCQLWLDGADTSSLVLSGSSLVSISDKCGNGYTLSGGSGWTYNVTKFNSSYPSFYRATKGSVLGQNNTFSITSSNITVFFVGEVVNTSGEYYLVDGGSAGINRFYTIIDTSTNIVHGNSVNANNNYSLPATVFRPFIFSQSTGTSPQTGSYNGTAINATAGTVGTITWSGITVGGRFTNASDWWSGHICEVIIYNTLLTSAQRQQMEGYLAWKWGIQTSLPSTHPFARTPSFATALYFPKAVPKITGTSGKHPVFMAGLQLWLDAADTSSMTLSGSTVTQWRDKSGNLRNTTSYAGTPALTTNAINGVQAINFNGSSSFIGSIPGSGSSYTLFFVGTFNNSTGTYGGLLCFGKSGTPDHVSGITNTKLTDTSMYSTIDSTNTAFTSNTLSTPFVYSVVIDGTFLNSFVNGNQQTPTNIAKSPSFNFTNYVVGDRAGSTSSIFLNGYVAEIVVYINAMTATQRQEVEGYLAWKWGLQSSLAAGHSYQTVVPIVIPYVNPVVRTTNNIRFSPTSIGGCQLWLDGADATSITGTTTVTQWRDKSGNARHLGVGSGTTSYSSNAIVLNSSYMFVTSAVDLSKVTVFIVVKTAGGGNQTVFTGRPQTSLEYNSLDGFGFFMDAQNSIRFYGQEPVGRFSTFNVNTSTPQVFSFQSSGTSVSGWYNGVSQSGGTLSSARTTTAQGFAIGASWSGSSYYNIVANSSLYEIIVYNSEISIAQRQQVEGYLAWKWALQTSLPTSHLYYKFPAGP